MKTSKERELNVGDILYSSWVYDQTNVNFFQVTKLIGATMVEVREIASKVDHSEIGADYVIPVKDGFLSPRGEWDKTGLPVKRKVSGTSLSFSDCQFASLWNGTPKFDFLQNDLKIWNSPEIKRKYKA